MHLDADGNWLAVGDLIRGINDDNYYHTNSHSLCKIIKLLDEETTEHYNIRVEILESYNSYTDAFCLSEDYTVNSSFFRLEVPVQEAPPKEPIVIERDALMEAALELIKSQAEKIEQLQSELELAQKAKPVKRRAKKTKKATLEKELRGLK